MLGTATISFLSANFLATATCNIATKMTSRELAVVLEKLAKIEHKQDEYQSNFLNSSSVNENADASAFVSGTSGDKGQKELLEELSQSITAIKATIKDLAKQIQEKEKRMDDLEQYGRSNCLILHGCVDLPKENAGYVTFENFVLDTLNSRLKFTHPIRNSDIDICHVLPSRKGKNPIIIKFVRRSVRNQVFNNKSLLKATKESDPKLAITESLTRRRSKLLEQSKKVFGFQNVWTQKGNIFCSFEGKRHRIDDFANIARIRFPKK